MQKGQARIQILKQLQWLLFPSILHVEELVMGLELLV